MHLVDWIVVGAYLAYVVIDGIRRSKQTDQVRGYFLANRSLPWWAVGLSIMATQMSAITLVGTTGQGYDDGMRLHPVLLRAAAGDDHPLRHRRSVLSPRRRLHGLRVSWSAGSTPGRAR